MKLSAPKNITWFIAVALAAIALVVFLAKLASATIAFWLAFASAALLVLATFLKGL
ncbi:MAG: hypothetical protein K6A14_06135 [Erysipelotrichaceae bacterium]|nr:hypothetical protein [Erysipelotrichaceae bacterium]